ncbi:carbohydrate sulfotransferase 6-like [Cololabis saira]|uniref:carbohydrate sulfotransferase 6-like n=1 Tax=Cololabis saira TaxID=129043 RepID=UPI002AD4348E|nr:carbohydrate sulfotransferase 6-like [Cololabis saira]
MCSRFEMLRSTLIFLVILQGAAMVLIYGWYLQVYRKPVNDPAPKVHVLLLSSFRSGSSFMGQVFNHNPSVFYLYEPSRHVWSTLQKYGARTLRMAMRDQIRSLFHCDFSVMDSYLPQNPRVSSLFAWSQSRALCSPPVCPITLRDQFNETQCKMNCNIEGLQKAQEACDMYNHVVLKIVRVYELESLYPLLEDPNLDLRIVHLVRDPRGLLLSRERSAGAFVMDDNILLEHRRVPPEEIQYRVMQEMCRSHVRINQRAVLNPPPFLKGRYKLVRFEDVACNAFKEINGIFEFVGLEMTPQLEEWLYTATHGKGRGNKKEAFQTSSRNATLVAEAWRTLLPYSKVKRLQEVCKGAMSLLGYKTVNNETEQKTLDMDLLTP